MTFSRLLDKVRLASSSAFVTVHRESTGRARGKDHPTHLWPGSALHEVRVVQMSTGDVLPDGEWSPELR